MCNVIGCFICAVLFWNRQTVRSENAGHASAKYLKKDFQSGLFFANFITEKSRYLNVSSIGTSTAVKRAGECSQACLHTPPCFSFNLASSPNADGKLLCELLPTDKFNSSDKLQVSEHFNHYSIKSVCDTKPCRNGGRCVAKYEEDDFSCFCASGYEGRYCERVLASWSCFNSTCFILVTTQRKWPEARAYCQSLGGDLAVIDTAAKQEFIKSSVIDKNGPWPWVGAYPDGVAWCWINNQTVNSGPTFWDDDQPGSYDNHAYFMCLKIDKGAVWHDCSKDVSLPCVCEKSS